MATNTRWNQTCMAANTSFGYFWGKTCMAVHTVIYISTISFTAAIRSGITVKEFDTPPAIHSLRVQQKRMQEIKKSPAKKARDF